MAAALPDPNSFSNPHQVRVSAFHLELEVDFERKVLKGHADLELEVTAEQAPASVVLDTKDLAVSAVTDLGAGGAALDYALAAEAHEAFGRALTVTLPVAMREGGAKQGRVRVAYETSPASSALQWLPAAQTAGKKHPYLFSQCQAIHARAMLPCQDSPGNKTPYTAALRVPAPLVGLMSALQDGEEASADGKSTVYRFRQPVPMSSYLVAIAVGALEKREIGPRSAVWSEAEMVEAGAHEFADTEKFIQAAEKVAGPYEWGRYDVLLLPPSFPYGGMENPCLTFVTPTLLAGDRSLANVVAHEIAHSWSGNWLSPATWESFWLNEGVCVFLERKIVRAVLGAPEQHLHAISGLNALREAVEHFGADHPYTGLHIKLDGVDPDDSFSSVPYEKGFNFLWYLEQLVGGDESLDDFLKEHFRQAQFGNVTTEKFKAKFLEYFGAKVAAEKLAEIDWDTWMYKPGMPPVENKFDTTLVDAASTLAKGLFDGSIKPADASVDGWSSNQIVVFLETVQDLQREAIEAGGDAKRDELAALMAGLDERLGLTKSRNSEIRHRWYQIAIRCEMESVMPAAAAFVVEQGRMKFTRTLYRDLFNSVKGKQLALDTFKEHRDSYHSICSKMVAKDLGLE